MASSAAYKSTLAVHILFGPQLLDFTQHSATHLRSTILERPSLQWLFDALLNLRGDWNSMAQNLPTLSAYCGDQFFAALQHFLRTGDDLEVEHPFPNILLTPLVVATHIVQYCALLELFEPRPSHWDVVQAWFSRNCIVTGLCTGLLTTSAIAAHDTWTDVKTECIMALRAAMLIGAVVDVNDTRLDGNRWTSFVVSSVDAMVEHLESIMTAFDDAYVPVDHGNGKFTLTAKSCSARALHTMLNDLDFQVAPISLKGAFHTPLHQEEATEVENALATSFPQSDVRSSHRAAIRAVLLAESNWTEEISRHRETSSCISTSTVAFGCPASIIDTLDQGQICAPVQLNGLTVTPDDLPRSLQESISKFRHRTEQIASTPEPIAIVGFACQLPGADDASEFWELLCDGPSQQSPLPRTRWGSPRLQTAAENNDTKWKGNFIEDIDTFDHKFFHHSPKEAANTDPQIRMMLQVAYRAVEQSGYFRNITEYHRHVGCYVGIAVNDYEHVVPRHDPSPYTVTGNLTAFAPGKISHFFGWTGPAVAINTACSSSAVAIHEACNAILAGDCVAALAGGVNVITSAFWFENLAAASFLSPTGQCKPFDEAADGYCRGDGIGALFLKRLSAARSDGDPIYGIIKASAHMQNRTPSTITVPSSDSLKRLYRETLLKGDLGAEDVSVVEAHGTGTRVGDAAEYDSLHQVFCDRWRREPLFIGSVKGLVGHAESAAGVVACVKVLLMLNRGQIPPQFSHRELSSRFDAIQSKQMQMQIAHEALPWVAPRRAALVNSHGASGSMTSILLSNDRLQDYGSSEMEPILPQYPFVICAATPESFEAYCGKLLAKLVALEQLHEPNVLPRISFHLTRQCNWALACRIAFTCSSVHDLRAKLFTAAQQLGRTISPSSRPVVLCFGGQTSAGITLDPMIYEACRPLKRYLDLCHRTAQSLGYRGIIPDIFEHRDREDIVLLHTMLFALQYSSAKAWIACRVPVAAVVGHSFGELTASCVSGILSLEDAIRIIVRRATVIQSSWGSFTVGYVCTDTAALASSIMSFDEEFPKGFLQHTHDSNSYTYGNIGQQDIVLCVLPMGSCQAVDTAVAAYDMLKAFPSIKLLILVSSSAGVVPDARGESSPVRLGDVIVASEIVTTNRDGDLEKKRLPKTSAFLADLDAAREWSLGEDIDTLIKNNERWGRKCKRPDDYIGTLDAIWVPRKDEATASIARSGLVISIGVVPSCADYRDSVAHPFVSTLQAGSELSDTDDEKTGEETWVVVPEDKAAVPRRPVVCYDDGHTLGLVGTKVFDAVSVLGISSYCDEDKGNDQRRWQKHASMAAAVCARKIVLCLDNQGHQ